MSDGFSVAPAGLREIAAKVRAAGSTAQAAATAFDGGAAVAATGKKSMPDPKSQAAFDERIKGVQTLLTQFVSSLGTWADGFTGSADYYERTDSSATVEIDLLP